jgi:hypothetical protein
MHKKILSYQILNYPTYSVAYLDLVNFRVI